MGNKVVHINLSASLLNDQDKLDIAAQRVIKVTEMKHPNLKRLRSFGVLSGKVPSELSISELKKLAGNDIEAVQEDQIRYAST